MTATTATVHQTVKNMISEIGQLRQLVAIDNMPHKLQIVRQLLRELDAELEAAQAKPVAALTAYYDDRANSGLANRAR